MAAKFSAFAFLALLAWPLGATDNLSGSGTNSGASTTSPAELAAEETENGEVEETAPEETEGEEAESTEEAETEEAEADAASEAPDAADEETSESESETETEDVPGPFPATSSESAVTNLLHAGVLETESRTLPSPIEIKPSTLVSQAEADPANRLDGIAQGVISAGAMLLVLAAASVYTGSLRKRLAQQNEFIHQRGEALAAVEARLRQSFAVTRSEMESDLQAQQNEIADLRAALEAETEARISAETALLQRSRQREEADSDGPSPQNPLSQIASSIVGPSEGTPCLNAIQYDLTSFDLPAHTAQLPHKRRPSPSRRRSKTVPAGTTA